MRWDLIWQGFILMGLGVFTIGVALLLTDLALRIFAG